MSGNGTITNQSIRSFVDRIETMDDAIKSINDDKKDLYQEVKSAGYDVKAVKAVIAIRRKDPDKLREHEEIVTGYLRLLGETGTDDATRAPARAREDEATA